MSVLSDLFQNIADAIRSKTGETDTMSPAQFPSAISGIETGVSSDLSYAVTFCNYDGTVLYQRNVTIGDDCPDPVEHGRIDTPTKTVNGEHMTWAGWSRVKGGAASTSALSNITEEVTLYACFKWTGTLDHISWAEISEVSLAGTASSRFKVGDTKAITLTNSDGTTESVLVAIAGFNLHRSTSGTKNGITFIQKGHRTAQALFSNGAVAVNDTYNLLNEDLKAVIRQSMITAGATATTTSVNVVTNYQYLFSPELTNLSTSLTNASGGSTAIVMGYYGSECNASQYTNPYDAGIFPLFSGMTKKELGQFLGITEAGVNICTRTRFYGKDSAYYSFSARIYYNSTYQLYKYGSSNGQGCFQFCFRV